ncbi:MAG: DUF1992 domain-containing protein [bacterium]
MDLIAILAEQKIKAAIKNGEFDNLPLKGKPLQLENDYVIRAALRMGFKILRNANVLPEEMRLRNEFCNLRAGLRCMQDEDEPKKLEVAISMLETRYNLLLGGTGIDDNRD